jgi:hypothetical protein
MRGETLEQFRPGRRSARPISTATSWTPTASATPCLLDTIAQGGGRFKGIAVVRNDISRDELLQLRTGGVIGVAFNATLLGVEHYISPASRPCWRWPAPSASPSSCRVSRSSRARLRRTRMRRCSCAR